MNKWMKQGMMGLILTTATVAAAAITSPIADSAAELKDLPSEHLMIDALDYAGGSKLKDRLVANNHPQQLEIIVLTSEV
jgi:hypothetical protein